MSTEDEILRSMSCAIESCVNKRACHVGSTIMEVEMTVFWYKRALVRNNNFTLPGPTIYQGTVRRL